MKTIFSIFIVLILSQVAFAQTSNTKKCTRTLPKEASYETEEKTHYIFTGTDTTGLNVKQTRITVMEGRRELVKRKKSKDCVSPNPEDCLIEVWEEIPPVTMNLLTVASPEITDQYEIRTEKVRKVVKEGQSTEVPVLCLENRSQSMIQSLQEALTRNGFKVNVSGVADESTLSAITAFQKSRGLAYGDITLEALNALGIK